MLNPNRNPNPDPNPSPNAFDAEVFKLLVSGSDFDVDRYLRSVEMPGAVVWHPENQPPGRPADLYSHGFYVPLGRIDPSDEQAEIARSFLDTHRVSLSLLDDYVSPTRVIVLCPTIECTPSITTPAFEVSPQLAELAGRLRFTLSVRARLLCPQNLENARHWMSGREPKRSP
jgi:hypothetical protein